MTKIRFQTDTRGRLTAQAQVQTEKGLRLASVRTEASEKKDTPSPAVWKQLVVDLFSEADKVRAGASKAGTGVL